MEGLTRLKIICQKLKTKKNFHRFLVKKEVWQQHKQNLIQHDKHALQLFIKKNQIILNKLFLIPNKVIMKTVNSLKKQENLNYFYLKKSMILK